MAVLNDLLVTGSARIVGSLSTNNFISGSGISDFSAGILKFDTINIPTSSNGTTYGVGTNGQVLKSNGATIYWSSDSNTTYTIATGDSNGQIKITPSSGSAYNVGVKGLGSAAYKDASGSWGISVTGSSASCTGNAATTTALKGATSSSAVPIAGLSAGYIQYFYNVNTGLTGNMPVGSNANGILQLNTHSGNYHHQLGFSSDGNMYHRTANGTALSNTLAWNKVLTSANCVTIPEGGTGAVNASGARINLGIKSGTSLPSSASEGDIFFLYS